MDRMADLLKYIMIYAGSALMVVNIVRYILFTKTMRWAVRSVQSRLKLYVPLALLIFFLAGYLFIGLIGQPDFMMAGILLGGSIFVRIILGTLFYIVGRVREDEKLHSELEEAKRVSEAKTVFFSNLTHDIRTPMNAVIGYTQLAGRPGNSESEMREYIGKIDSASRQLLSLLNDVLEMSQIESGKMELEEEETDLAEVVFEMRDLFSEQMLAKKIAFTADVSRLENRRVFCDKRRLSRVLLNLISNACKFTPEGGSVGVTLRQTGADADGELLTGRYELTVKDTGIGMSREFAEKVFETFSRERNTTVSGIQGTGLGMSITKSIVDLMNGTIELQTAPGEGSEFTVRLSFPVCQEEAKEADDGSAVSCEVSAGGEAPDAADHDLRGVRLLLAEDNAVNREIACLLLEEYGFEIDTAENGQEAAERLADAEAGTYAAVLMDVQMPVMNGYDATRRIRALEDPLKASIPVIAMTANAFREDIENEHAAGMTAHLSKPLDAREMLRTLARILDEGSHVTPQTGKSGD